MDDKAGRQQPPPLAGYVDGHDQIATLDDDDLWFKPEGRLRS